MSTIQPKPATFSVPNSLVDRGVSLEALAVYCYIARHEGASPEDLYAALRPCGMRPYHVVHALYELRDAGFISDEGVPPYPQPSDDDEDDDYALEIPSRVPFLEKAGKDRNREGYVYVIESGGQYKIGRTLNPRGRVQNFHTHSPHPFKLITLIRVPDMFEAEKALHKVYGSRRQAGEWFALTADDVAELVDWQERKGEPLEGLV